MTPAPACPVCFKPPAASDGIVICPDCGSILEFVIFSGWVRIRNATVQSLGAAQYDQALRTSRAIINKHPQ